MDFLERFGTPGKVGWRSTTTLTGILAMVYGSAAISHNTPQHTAAHTTALYEHMALPDAFLNDYYSQKAMCALPAKDCSWSIILRARDPLLDLWATAAPWKLTTTCNSSTTWAKVQDSV
ncbi:hypothetical protein KUCAC02_033793 [Chaenocephalus aceratus]|nr:hypothetical protein KUCAC02_033793 [Chaenocephalus aceratus]